MSQGRDRKILRVGIIQNGKIIEERLLRKRDGVTIGQSPRNTFVLPTAGIPKSYTLFDMKSGQYHLNFKPNMKGKVSVEDAVLDFQALRDQKLAKKRGGDQYSLPLSEKSRGKVVVDDVTLLFQFVTPPPPPSKLQLPASVRGGWAKSLDWPFVSTLLGSFVVQVFSVAFMTTRDYPEPPQGINTLPDRFVQMIKEDFKPKPKPKPEEKEGDESKEKAEEKKADKKPKPKAEPKPKATPEPAKTTKAVERAIKVKKVQDRTILKFIGTEGGGGPGDIVNALKGGVDDVAIAQAFDGTTGVMVADNAQAARDRRRVGRSRGKVARVKGDLRAKGGEAVGTGGKKEVKVKGTVKVKRPSEAFGTGVLDGNSIAKVVRRRKGAIKNCYERQLKRNPKLSGKVKVQFTILESGRVGQTRILEDSVGDPQVGRCIASAMKRWRFPKPDGGSVTVAFPFVFAPSG